MQRLLAPRVACVYIVQLRLKHAARITMLLCCFVTRTDAPPLLPAQPLLSTLADATRAVDSAAGSDAEASSDAVLSGLQGRKMQQQKRVRELHSFATHEFGFKQALELSQQGQLPLRPRTERKVRSFTLASRRRAERDAKAHLKAQVEQSYVGASPGRIGPARASTISDTHTGARAKLGSVRALSFAMGIPRSTIHRWLRALRQRSDSAAAAAGSRAPSAPAAAPSAAADASLPVRRDGRGGANRKLTPQLESLLREFVYARSAQAVGTDVRDLAAAAAHFRRLLAREQRGGASSDASTASTGSGDPELSESRRAEDAAVAGASADEAAPLLDSAAAGWHSAFKLKKRADRVHQRNLRYGLSRTSLHRVCKRQRISLKRAQPQKQDRMRPTLPAEVQSFHSVVNKFQRRQIWVVDETHIKSTDILRASLGEVGLPTTYVAGKQRGPGFTVVVNAMWCVLPLRAVCGSFLSCSVVCLAVLCSDETGAVRAMPVLVIEHHDALPAAGSKSQRVCPLAAKGVPCDCDRVDVYGVHNIHLEYLFGTVYPAYYSEGDAQVLDLLRSHYSYLVASALFKCGVTGLWQPGGTPRAAAGSVARARRLTNRHSLAVQPLRPRPMSGTRAFFICTRSSSTGRSTRRTSTTATSRLRTTRWTTSRTSAF